MAAPTTDRQNDAVHRTLRVAFVAVVVVFALLHFFLSPLQLVVLGWFLEPAVVSHRVHEISFGLVFALSLAGLLAQLRNPQRKIAAMYQVVIPIWLTAAAILLLDRAADLVVFVFMFVPILLVALHPSRGQFWRPPARPSRILAAFAIAGAVPLLAFAVMEFRIGQEGSRVARGVFDQLPESASDAEINRALANAADTAEELQSAQHYVHWSAMGGFALTIAALGGIAALRVPGWRLPAWSAGIAAAEYGAASLFASSDASAAAGVWAVLAILWGAGFITAAEWQRRREASSSAVAEASSGAESIA